MKHVFRTLVLSMFLCAPAFAEMMLEQSKRYHPQRLLVKFKSEASAYEESGATMMGRPGQSKTLRLIHVDSPDDLQETLENYRNDPDVLYAEPDYEMHAFVTTPNDSDYSKLYGMAKISAEKAWDTHKGSGQTLVAIIDTGVDYNHPDLKANIWKNDKEIPDNKIDDDNNGCVDDIVGCDFGSGDNDPMDTNGHGTHVAGTIGALGNNAMGVTGVNWNVKILPIRFLGGPSGGLTSTAIASLRYAIANGAKISNNSWGGGAFSQALLDEIRAARAAGHLFIAAAGNSSADNDKSPVYPASYDSDNIISVASTNINDLKSSFSCFGLTSVDLGAPGSGIWSTIPGGSYGEKSGTSMASPHVAGAAALLWDKYPTLTYAEVLRQVLHTGDSLTSLQGVVATGRRLNVANVIAPTGAPSKMEAQPLSPSEIKVTWKNEAGDAKAFTVERTLTPASSASWAKIADTAGSATTFDDKGLSEGKQYHYRVRAVKARGDFAISAEFLGRLTKPASPTDLKGVAGDANQVELSWVDKSDDESKMKVERSLTSNGTFESIAELAANTKAYTDTKVETGKTYFYKVSAVNPVGANSSNEVSVEIKVPETKETPSAPSADEERSPALQAGAGVEQPKVEKKSCLFVNYFQGTPQEGELSQVRHWRDRYLKPYALGRLVIHAYYRMSPSVIKATEESPQLKVIVGVGLEKALILASR